MNTCVFGSFNQIDHTKGCLKAIGIVWIRPPDIFDGIDNRLADLGSLQFRRRGKCKRSPCLSRFDYRRNVSDRVFSLVKKKRYGEQSTRSTWCTVTFSVPRSSSTVKRRPPPPPYRTERTTRVRRRGRVIN